MPKQESDLQGNSAVERALMILEYISKRRNGTTLADLVKEIDIPKSTLHRLLETMRNVGFVELEADSERYIIGLKAIDVGISGLSNKEVVDVAAPYLREMAEKTGETSFLGVYNEGNVVYLYKAEGTQSILMTSQLGSRRPIHCTGLGKSILSTFSMEEVDKILQEKGMPQFTENTITTPQQYHDDLRQIRINGFAHDAEELEKGLSCYAVPLFNYSGRAVGAICISGPVMRIRSNKEMLVSILKESGDLISRRLGYVPSMRNNRLLSL